MHNGCLGFLASLFNAWRLCGAGCTTRTRARTRTLAAKHGSAGCLTSVHAAYALCVRAQIGSVDLYSRAVSVAGSTSAEQGRAALQDLAAELDLMTLLTGAAGLLAARSADQPAAADSMLKVLTAVLALSSTGANTTGAPTLTDVLSYAHDVARARDPQSVQPFLSSAAGQASFDAAAAGLARQMGLSRNVSGAHAGGGKLRHAHGAAARALIMRPHAAVRCCPQHHVAPVSRVYLPLTSAPATRSAVRHACMHAGMRPIIRSVHSPQCVMSTRRLSHCDNQRCCAAQKAWPDARVRACLCVCLTASVNNAACRRHRHHQMQRRCSNRRWWLRPT